MTDDPRLVALVLARARAVTGLVCLLLPGVVARLWFGRAHTGAGTSAAVRMLGVRDTVLGIGAITAVKEQQQGPEWVSMGAVCDGVDAAVSLLTPRLPLRGRLVALVAGAAAFVGLQASKQLAAERAAEAAAAAEAIADTQPVPGV